MTATIAPAAGPADLAEAGERPATAIRTQGLTKHYGSRAAVDQLSIQVPTGVVAGFVGLNGAGKTTTIRMLLGLITPSEGSAEVLGQPISHPAAYLPRVRRSTRPCPGARTWRPWPPSVATPGPGSASCWSWSGWLSGPGTATAPTRWA
jgi:energy-coupling factor transporter ATP-binding protein EcfA2